jgi:hypothetical protein
LIEITRENFQEQVIASDLPLRPRWWRACLLADGDGPVSEVAVFCPECAERFRER